MTERECWLWLCLAALCLALLDEWLRARGSVQ